MSGCRSVHPWSCTVPRGSSSNLYNLGRLGKEKDLNFSIKMVD